MAGKVVDVTLRLIDKVTAPLGGVESKLKNSANQWTKAGRQIQNAGKSISAVGSSMTKKLTVPIVGAGVASVKLASDFESGMSKVQSIAGTVKDRDLPALEEEAKKMGLSFKEGSKVPMTALNTLMNKP